jgi:hypothetical protein
MKHFSTGTGIAVLGVCILAATVVATHRGGSEAFAQSTGNEPTVVAFAVGPSFAPGIFRYHRLFSDGTVQISAPVSVDCPDTNGAPFINSLNCNGQPRPVWQTVPLPPTGLPFLTDVDGDREVGGGDVSQVLLDWGTIGEQAPPMQIDCTLNQIK